MIDDKNAIPGGDYFDPTSGTPFVLPAPATRVMPGAQRDPDTIEVSHHPQLFDNNVPYLSNGTRIENGASAGYAKGDENTVAGKMFNILASFQNNSLGAMEKIKLTKQLAGLMIELEAEAADLRADILKELGI